MNHWRRRSLLMSGRRRRRRINVVLNWPLRTRRERLLRRIMLPIRRYRSSRAVIIRTPYRFWLMVVTSTVEIASTIAIVLSRLLLYDPWIAVAISSPAFIGSIRLGLRWRIVSPRHSRHVVIRVYVPITLIAT